MTSLPPDTITLGIRNQHKNLGVGDTDTQSIAVCLCQSPQSESSEERRTTEHLQRVLFPRSLGEQCPMGV